MKKQFQYHVATLLAILTICCTSMASLSAQNAWGIRAGTNLAKWRSSEKEVTKDMKMSAGLLISVPFELGISKTFAVQIEPSFIQKGFRVNSSETNGGTTYSSKGRYTVNYTELPVLAKLNFGKSKTRFNVVLGPSIGYAASGRSKGTSTVNGKTTDVNEKLKFGKDEFPRLDFGLNGGVGISFGTFGFDIRYGLGLKNLLSKGDLAIIDKKITVNNDGLQLALSYMLPMGKKAAK